jgi:hypothetical protein
VPAIRVETRLLPTIYSVACLPARPALAQPVPLQQQQHYSVPPPPSPPPAPSPLTDMSAPYRAADRPRASPQHLNRAPRTNRNSLQETSQLMEDLSRLLTDSDRSFKKKLDEEALQQQQRHVEALDRALKQHEAVRKSAEHTYETIQLEIERQRIAREASEARRLAEERRKLEEAKQAEIQRLEDARLKELELRREQERQRQEREQAQKRQEEEVEAQNRARQKAEQERLAAEKRAQEEAASQAAAARDAQIKERQRRELIRINGIGQRGRNSGLFSIVPVSPRAPRIMGYVLRTEYMTAIKQVASSR